MSNLHVKHQATTDSEGINNNAPGSVRVIRRKRSLIKTSSQVSASSSSKLSFNITSEKLLKPLAYFYASKPLQVLNSCIVDLVLNCLEEPKDRIARVKQALATMVASDEAQAFKAYLLPDDFPTIPKLRLSKGFSLQSLPAAPPLA